MNKVGKVTRGNEIGKRSKEWFVWAVCPDCGKERWVRRSKTKLRDYTGWCQVCNAKRNNKMRTYNKSIESLAWKGGRTTDHGYILVLLQPADFFFPMVNNKGYVREHRLVVAKALKRCLLPWEVVHHKGAKYPLGSIENKQDNRYPENLALLGSNNKHNKEVERLIKQARNAGYEVGYEQGWDDNKPYLPDANEPWDTGKIIFEDGKKAGIKEVVEWIEENISMTLFTRPQWREKLEEWKMVKKEICKASHCGGDDTASGSSKGQQVKTETKYLYPYSKAERDYEDSL